MNVRQKLTLLCCLGLGAATLVVGGVLFIAGGEGSSDLEQWIGKQIVGVLEAYTTTTTTFDTIDYQAPGTVAVTAVSMTGGGQELIGADRLLLELAEVPSLGKPLQIKRIEVEVLRLNFVQAEGGGFVGWNDFIPKSVVTDPDAIPAGLRLSDVLVLRDVQIENGVLVYDAGDGSNPMVFRGITTAMDTLPDADAPGWYDFKGKLGRPPVSEMEIDARLNLDSAVLEAERLNLSVTLSEEQYENFPPQLQDLLRKHEVKGNLTFLLTGTFPLTDWMRSSMQFEIALKAARVAFGNRILTVDHVGLKGKFADEKADVRYDARLLDGEVEGRVALRVTGPRPLTASWKAKGIKLEQTIRTLTDGPPPYAGTVRSEGQFEADLAGWPTAVGGGGTLHIAKGRLILMPGVRDLLKLLKISRDSTPGKATSRADIEFAFAPTGVRIERGELESSYAAARMTGMIFYEGRLDLDVNAGPLEKVQSLLGKAGEWLGKISDKVITYRIHGPFDAPQVGVKPFAADLRK